MNVLLHALPLYSIIAFILLFSALLYATRKRVRLWAMLTLPGTALHELAHALVGVLLAAQPGEWSLFPQRISAERWRLGSVQFARLRWWNAGAVALAPLLWCWLFLGMALAFPMDFKLGLDLLTLQVPSWLLLCAAAGLVWLVLAVWPSTSDWRLASENWPSAIGFVLVNFTFLILI